MKLGFITLNDRIHARLVYILVVSCALCIIVLGINKKAYQAIAPPVYDPMGYYVKSQITWEAICNRQWPKSFSQLPSRPPGIAIILYPFGFNPSIQSFLFRSAVAPIVIWALALISILLPRVKDLKGAMAGSFLTAGFLAMPIFYHFEYPSDIEKTYGISIQWGLVDVLQGSVGALALALLFTGVSKRINALVVLGWLTGAYTFFIKPSGILVQGCLLLIFIAETAILWKQGVHNKRKFILKAITMLVVGIGITTSSIWLAMSSGYLSKEVIHSAQSAAKILLQMRPQSLWPQLAIMVAPIFGYWWIFPVAGAALTSLVAFVCSICKRQFSEVGLRLAIALLISSAALYWWMVMAGQEARYLFPFIMLIMNWLIVPILFNGILKLQGITRYAAMAYCIIPVLAIITLLNIQYDKKTAKIEKFFGYNLDAGQYDAEVKLGRDLLREAKKEPSPISIYSIGSIRVGVVEMIDLMNSVENAGEPQHFKIYRVNDWAHPGIKIKQLLACNYIIVEKAELDRVTSGQSAVKRWEDESIALVSFIKSSEASPSFGIKLIQSGPVMLYKITNREKLAGSCKKWVSSIQWSDDFWVRNSYSRGDFDAPGLKVLDLKTCNELLSKHASLLPKIDFGQKITLLGIWRKSEKEKSEPSSKYDDDLVEFIFRAEQDVPSGYTIFIHIMDNNKKIIFQHDFQIDPDRMVIPANTIWESSVAIPRAELVGAYSLGFGAYIPNKEGTILESKYKQSDWNGKRVLLPLK